MQGSGYKNIGAALVSGLVERGLEVTVFGLGYRGEPHDLPFGICPAHTGQLPSIVSILPTAPDLEIEAWVVALDIPVQLNLLRRTDYGGNIPWIGIFPVEGDPLCATWATRLWGMAERLIISRFGVQEAQTAGLPASHLQVGVDCEFWEPPTLEERQLLRKALDLEHKFVVLTVADNQERKNLSAGMEIMGKVVQDLDAVWCLVTRPESPIGWELQDLAQDYGVNEHYLEWERGIPHTELRDLYAMADAFLLPSKAEGLGMPVLEAMAMGVPVVATDACALHEHLVDGRGFLIEPEYVHRDPWGNSRRYYISVESAALTLKEIPGWRASGALDAMVKEARAYVVARDWGIAVDALMEAIGNVKA